MLIVECKRPNSLVFHLRTFSVSIVDTDDGIREDVNVRQLASLTVPVINLKLDIDNRSVSGEVSPLIRPHQYELDGVLYIFKYNEVYAIYGNDRYNRLLLYEDGKLFQNGLYKGSAECLGIPSRTVKNSDMKVRTYSLMTIPFEIVLRREEAISEKGIRQHVLRKILFQ